MQVLKAAGKNLTRAGLMKAARSMNYIRGKKNANPFALPGVSVFTKGNVPVPDLAGDGHPVRRTTSSSRSGTLINGRGALR